MKLKLLFFASVRETVGLSHLVYQASPSVVTVQDLRLELLAQYPDWEKVLHETFPLKIACNQEMASAHTPLHDGDEVAFFPPVTGG